MNDAEASLVRAEIEAANRRAAQAEAERDQYKREAATPWTRGRRFP